MASRALFGSCLHIVANLLPRFGIETVFVDGTDLDQWRDTLKSSTQAVFLELPSNLTLEIIDLPALCDLAHASGATVIVDNVFALPLLQKLLELGAGIVVYLATKHIDGQGRCLGGAVLGMSKFVDGSLFAFLKHIGPALSPFNAWLLLKGLEMLDLRMERHGGNAGEVARWLEACNGVLRTLWPHLESHPQIELARKQMTDGGSAVAFELNALNLVDISNNLGDSKASSPTPATKAHSKLSQANHDHLAISDGLVHLHAGPEDIADIKDELTQTLAA